MLLATYMCYAEHQRLYNAKSFAKYPTANKHGIDIISCTDCVSVVVYIFHAAMTHDYWNS